MGSDYCVETGKIEKFVLIFSVIIELSLGSFYHCDIKNL